MIIFSAHKTRSTVYIAKVILDALKISVYSEIACVLIDHINASWDCMCADWIQ